MKEKYNKPIGIFILCIFLTVFTLKVKSCLANKISVVSNDDFLNIDNCFYDQDGKKIYLDEFEGQTILLVFWATWCSSCVSELASLDNLQKDFRKLPFKIIALSEDFQNIEVVKNHFEKHGIRYLGIYHDRQNNILRELGIAGLPTVFLIDAKGKRKLEFKGKVKWHDDEVRRIILSEIEGAPELPKNTFKIDSFITSPAKPNIDTNIDIRDEEKIKEEVNDEQISK